MEQKISKKKIEAAFYEYKEKAKRILDDDAKINSLLENLEKKLKTVPAVGTGLADIVIMAEMIKAYVRKEYTEIPVGATIIAVAAVLYFVTPFDLIPDMIPMMGFADDIGVAALSIRLIHEDLMQFKAWQAARDEEILEASAAVAADADYIEEE